MRSPGTLTITLGDSASPTLALSTLAQGTLGARDGARFGKQVLHGACHHHTQSLLRCCPLDCFAAVPTSVRPPHPPAPQSADLYTLCGLLPCRRHLHSRQATAAPSQSRPPAYTRVVIALCAPWPGPLPTHTPWLHCAHHGRSLFDRVLTVLFCPCHVSAPTCGYSLRNSQPLTAVHCEKWIFFCVSPTDHSRQPRFCTPRDFAG